MNSECRDGATNQTRPWFLLSVFLSFVRPFFLSFFFFSSPNLSGRTVDVYHTSTHGVALVRIWNACLKSAGRGSLKTQDGKWCKNRHLRTIAQLCRASQLSIGKKLVKQQYVLHVCPQYGEPRPINGWDLQASLRHPSKFQRVSRLAFLTAATSLTGGQTNFARCLAISWAAALYVHFRGSCPWQNFARCKIQFLGDRL